MTALDRRYPVAKEHEDATVAVEMTQRQLCALLEFAESLDIRGLVKWDDVYRDTMVDASQLGSLALGLVALRDAYFTGDQD